MCRLMFPLSLIAALAGTPLRQMEAANDFACSLAELGSGDIIEVVDGGVGDDSGATIQAGMSHASAMLAMADALPAHLGLILSPPRPTPQSRADRTPRFPAGSPQRHALLQHFLF